MLQKKKKPQKDVCEQGCVLVTGGFGLTGSWVVHHLASAGRRVLVLDRSHMLRDYLEPFKENIKYYPGEPTDIRAVYEVFAENRGQIEGVIHLARAADRQWPYTFVEVNVMGVANLLEALRLNGVKRIVMRSSGAIYGDQERELDESAPARPLDLYGATMSAAEMIALQYAKESNLFLRIVRTSQIYGPGKVPTPGDIFSPLAGEPLIELPSGWDDRRDLTYVKDAARGIVLAYEAREVDYQIFNISGGVSYSMEDIVEVVKQHATGPIKVKIGAGVSSARFAGAGPLKLDRARTVLGYEPEYDLENGLAEYVQWLKTRSATPTEIE